MKSRVIGCDEGMVFPFEYGQQAVSSLLPDVVLRLRTRLFMREPLTLLSLHRPSRDRGRNPHDHRRKAPLTIATPAFANKGLPAMPRNILARPAKTQIITRHVTMIFFS